MADYDGKILSESLLLDMYRKLHRQSSLRWNRVLHRACTDPVPSSSAASPPYRPCPIIAPAGSFITGLIELLIRPSLLRSEDHEDISGAQHCDRLVGHIKQFRLYDLADAGVSSADDRFGQDNAPIQPNRIV